MPIYEYRCQSCGHELEVMQRMSADPLSLCPACSQDALKKLISQTSFQLKGSGWYVTDYKGKKGPGGGSSDNPAGGDAKPTAPAKGDSGSAPKTAAAASD